MAIKAGFTLAEWIARLTKGYFKATGRQPDGLAKLKIKMEAADKVRQQNKILKPDFSKGDPKEWTDRVSDAFVKGTKAKNKEAAYNMALKRYESVDRKFLPQKQIENIYRDLAKDSRGREIILRDIGEIEKREMFTTMGNQMRQDILSKLRGLSYKPNPFKNKPTGKKDPNFDPDPTGMASGGIAGQLHMNEGGRVGLQEGGPLSEQDFYSQFYGMPYAGYEGQYFKTLQDDDPNYDEIRRSSSAGSFADLVNRGLVSKYSGPTDYQTYLSNYTPVTQSQTGDASIAEQIAAQDRAAATGDKGIMSSTTADYYKPLLEKIGALRSPITTFLTGGELAPRTASQDNRIKEMIEKQMRETGQLSGRIGYEDYSKSQAPGTVNPNMYTFLKDLVVGDTTAEDLGNMGQLGTFNWDVDPKTGKVDFNRGGSNIYDFKEATAQDYPEDNPVMSFFRQKAQEANKNKIAINPDVTISGFGNNQANTLDPRMLGAQDKGLDARMGRTYAENVRTMADPRMLQASGGLAKILGV